MGRLHEWRNTARRSSLVTLIWTIYNDTHFLDYVGQHDRVWVTRRIDIARHWKATHPFDPATAFLWE